MNCKNSSSCCCTIYTIKIKSINLMWCSGSAKKVHCWAFFLVTKYYAVFPSQLSNNQSCHAFCPIYWHTFNINLFKMILILPERVFSTKIHTWLQVIMLYLQNWFSYYLRFDLCDDRDDFSYFFFLKNWAKK